MGLIGGPNFDAAREGSGGAVHRDLDEAYFTQISDDLADKGFLVTASDDLINWARTGSLMWMTFGDLRLIWHVFITFQ